MCFYRRTKRYLFCSVLFLSQHSRLTIRFVFQFTTRTFVQSILAQKNALNTIQFIIIIKAPRRFGGRRHPQRDTWQRTVSPFPSPQTALHHLPNLNVTYPHSHTHRANQPRPCPNFDNRNDRAVLISLKSHACSSCRTMPGHYCLLVCPLLPFVLSASHGIALPGLQCRHRLTTSPITSPLLPSLPSYVSPVRLPHDVLAMLASHNMYSCPASYFLHPI